MKTLRTYIPDRLLYHLALLALSVVGCLLAGVYARTATATEVLTIGSGYVALLLIALSLLIGPLNLWRKRRNPVNIDFRRDVGIWAGINTCIHVIFGFQVFSTGQALLTYFLNPDNSPRVDLFGWSNDVGLVAFLVLLPLLITSNQISLRLLKGKRWKTIQRFTYPVFGLGILHTLGYQVFDVRESIFTISTIALTLAVIVAQTIGIVLTVMRSRERQTVHGPSKVGAAIQSGAVPAEGIARRHFLKLAGASLIGGAAFGLAGAAVLRSQTAPTVASVPTPPPADTGNAPSQSDGQQSAPPTAGNAATAPGSTRTVLATLTTLGTGKALAFTTPDTNESAFVIHRTDGSVVCFSGICTHRPYDLQFDESQQQLFCALHSVPFDIQDGAPTQPPARSPLKRFNVTVDGQGNIVYSQA